MNHHAISSFEACKLAVRYQQRSAEIMALQLQTYNLATARLDDIMSTYASSKPAAVILDVDETILDNSRLFVHAIRNHYDYSCIDNWDDWEHHGKPPLIPGARTFLEHAVKHGVRIFYVTDRTQRNSRFTLRTLKRLGLPQVDSDNVLFGTMSKGQRRRRVRQEHTIVMLIGDRLPDVSTQFGRGTSLARQRERVMDQAERFGRDWFILPNATYGAWVNAKLQCQEGFGRDPGTGT